jgi:hypothetical protein
VAILVVGIDPNDDIMKQLRHIAEVNRMPILDVVSAWRGQTTVFGTAPALSQRIVFEEIKKYEEKEEPEIRHDYQAVKERNRFFNKRKRG